MKGDIRISDDVLLLGGKRGVRMGGECTFGWIIIYFMQVIAFQRTNQKINVMEKS